MAGKHSAKQLWLLGLIGLMGLFVLAAVAMRVVTGVRQMNQGDPGRPLAAAIPERIPGWNSRPLALSDTEEGVKAVAETLRYDEVFFREYASPRGRLQVYAAFWGPRKMPPHLVASHTPDICWAQVGWNCLEKRRGERAPWKGPALWPAQARRFQSAGGDVQHVLFWHLVDGRPYDISMDINQTPNPVLYWRDVLRFQLGWSRIQYFVRLSCDHPFSDLEGDPGWEQLMASLAGLGLKQTD